MIKAQLQEKACGGILKKKYRGDKNTYTEVRGSKERIQAEKTEKKRKGKNGMRESEERKKDDINDNKKRTQ